MSLAYAPRGLFGVLTPQANTTVEPELHLMLPKGIGFINGRLTSSKATIAERLLDYFAHLDDALPQFANAPIGAIAIACTGASYLAGVEVEDAALERLQAASRVPVVTAASAVCDALRVLGARRVGFVTPYDAALNRASETYWTKRGFEVSAKASAWRETDAFHPIYSLPGGAAFAALDQIEGADLDAVVMLGTGMPTLEAIRKRPRLAGAPVFSCMLALGWRAAIAVENRVPSRNELLAWIDAAHWGKRIDRLATV